MKHDFVVADGDSHAVVGQLARNGHFHRTVFVGSSAAPDARSRVSRPIDPVRILSCLDELATLHRAQHAAAGQSDAGQEQRHAAKARARASARRARLETMALEADSAGTTHSVLVLDDRDTDRAHLCSLLSAFGFQPCASGSVGHTQQMLAQQPFEAVFLALVMDDGDVGGAALCQGIKQAEREAIAHTAVVLVSESTQADRVRAVLAGGDAVLTKPLARGDVARALELCSVRLPADPRRH